MAFACNLLLQERELEECILFRRMKPLPIEGQRWKRCWLKTHLLVDKSML